VNSPANRTFGSDNHAGVHPAVLAAIAAANAGDAVAYGNDELTSQTRARLCGLTGAHDAYLVFNGTAANVLGLSLLLRPYEAVICAETSHLNVDECGAAERILGCKLLTVDTPDGKLTPALIERRLGGRGDEHRAQPRVVQLAQVTELGTCYSLPELISIRGFCDANGLLCYIDGARLANAVAHEGCPVAEMAACADVLSFGATKNGALGVEAVLVMRDDLAAGVQFQRKQLMQLASKMRFLAAQVAALLDDDLWLSNARRANAMGRRLAEALATTPGVRLPYPVQSNGVFAEIGKRAVAALQQDWDFHVWSDAEDGRCVVRWMAAFDTSEADVDVLAAAIRQAATGPERRDRVLGTPGAPAVRNPRAVSRET
jgi:threonine aldolase